MALRTSWRAALAPVLLLSSALLLLLVTLAGVHNGLPQLYYLNIDTTQLSAPSKLANSSILADLSIVSGTDLVGSTATASSLGLAPSYTINLLTSCAHEQDGSVQCTLPEFSYAFSPFQDLRLDATSLQDARTDSLTIALENYSRMATYFGSGYSAAIALTLLSVLTDIFSRCMRVAGLLALVMAVAATAVELAASVAVTVIFSRIRTALNDSFGSAGLTTSLGTTPIFLSFVAFALSLLSTILLGVSYRSASSAASPRRRRSGGGRVSFRDMDGSNGGAKSTGRPLVVGEDDVTGARARVGGAKTAGGLLGFLPGFNRHKYVQVEKQQQRGAAGVAGAGPPGYRDEAQYRSTEEDVQPQLDDNWAARDDYSHPFADPYHNNHRENIPMRDLDQVPAGHDEDTGYEAYRDTPNSRGAPHAL